ncbi:MAG TPA: hydrolase, partial [Paraburkholderia sp.]
ERLDLAAPHRGERWWRNVVEIVDAPKASRRWFSCRDTGQANS